VAILWLFATSYLNADEMRYEGRTFEDWEADLQAHTPAVRIKAFEALAHFGPRAVSALIKTFRSDPDEHNQAMALVALTDIEPQTNDTVRVLLEAATTDPTSAIGTIATMIIVEDKAFRSRIGPDTVPALIEAMREANVMRRVLAIELLANRLAHLGPAAKQAVPTLRELADHDPEPRVRAKANEVLKLIRTSPQTGAALAPAIVPQTAEPGSGGQTATAYGWWNIVVPLLATIGLLVLSRVRLSVIPTEVASGEPSVAEHSAWARAPGRIVRGPIWGRILKLPWLARLSILIVILTVGGLFYYPEQVSYTFTLIDVPFPGALGTVAMGINDQGQIVGHYFGPGGGVFLYDKGVFTPINASFPCAFSIIANGINARGQIVGDCSDSSGTLHGFLYDQGVFTRIDVPGASSTDARGINARGQVVGTYGGRAGGFLYDKGVFTRIDVPFPDAFATTANGINDHGQVVGDYIDRGSAESPGFLYDKGVFTPINVPGAIYTTANGINDHGQIVGGYSDSSGKRHGFLYEKGVFTPIDVPFPGADYLGVSGINARGQIVGYYYNESGSMHGSFLATPHKKVWLWASFIAVLLLAVSGLLVLSREI
jgi:probable HAF family extracellular repeat protein